MVSSLGKLEDFDLLEIRRRDGASSIHVLITLPLFIAAEAASNMHDLTILAPFPKADRPAASPSIEYSKWVYTNTIQEQLLQGMGMGIGLEEGICEVDWLGFDKCPCFAFYRERHWAPDGEKFGSQPRVEN
ncbi:hypothetical protein ACLOJK_036883 [Asimina triloba]